MSNTRLLFASIVLGAVTAVTTVPADATDDGPTPPQDKVCGRDRIVDKDKFAAYLIAQFPVSVLAYTPSATPEIQKLSLSRQILASNVLSDPKSCAACSASDRKALKDIFGYLSEVLEDYRSRIYEPTKADVLPQDYFRGSSSDNAIRCVTVVGVPATSPSAKFEKPTSNTTLRVRGTSADLYIDQSATTDFTASSKATFSLTQDNVARKDTYQITADVGYYIPLTPSGWMAGERLELIPYIGTNWNDVTVEKGSTSKPSVGTETVDAGALLDAYLISNANSTRPVGHLLTLQPDYLLNNVDDSRIASANLVYTPLANGIVNSFRSVWGLDDLVSFEWVAAFKDDNGIYTDRGKTSVIASRKNYVRLGGEMGLSFVSDVTAVPLSLSTSYTRLHPITGLTEVGYFSNSLTYSFDPKRYFGVSLSYVNGNREDTGARQSQWIISLSGHY
jgi:hypothetical protein